MVPQLTDKQGSCIPTMKKTRRRVVPAATHRGPSWETALAISRAIAATESNSVNRAGFGYCRVLFTSSVSICIMQLVACWFLYVKDIIVNF